MPSYTSQVTSVPCPLSPHHHKTTNCTGFWAPTAVPFSAPCPLPPCTDLGMGCGSFPMYINYSEATAFIHGFRVLLGDGIQVAHRVADVLKCHTIVSIPLCLLSLLSLCFLTSLLQWINCPQILIRLYLWGNSDQGRISPSELTRSVRTESPEVTCDHSFELPGRGQRHPQHL